MLGPKFLFTKTTLLSTPKHFMKAAPSARHYLMNCFSITQVQSATTGTGNECRQRRRTEPSADKHAGLQCYTLDTVSCLDARIESTINNRASRLWWGGCSTLQRATPWVYKQRLAQSSWEKSWFVFSIVAFYLVIKECLAHSFCSPKQHSSLPLMKAALSVRHWGVGSSCLPPAAATYSWTVSQSLKSSQLLQKPATNANNAGEPSHLPTNLQDCNATILVTIVARLWIGLWLGVCKTVRHFWWNTPSTCTCERG